MARPEKARPDIMRCDILVCGAGPAGSCAARAAAQAGAKVLVLERRATIGVPVRCAEYIPAQLAGQIPVPAGTYAVQKTASMRAYLHGACIQDLAAPGCIVRRDALDQALAEAARAEGARILTEHALLGLEDEHTARVALPDGRTAQVQADIVIGADGPLSRVAAFADRRQRELLPALQLRLPLREPLDHTRVYFDEDLCAGYAWLFPRGNMANVGLGCVNRKDQASLYRKLEQVVDQLCREGLIERPAQGTKALFTGGWIPVEERPCVQGSIVLAGDAAGHTHPITGAGIAQAVLAGEMAGRWAASACGQGSLEILQGYAEEWQDFYGDVLAHARRRRLAWEAHTGSLDTVIRSFWIGNREYYAARDV